MRYDHIDFLDPVLDGPGKASEPVKQTSRQMASSDVRHFCIFGTVFLLASCLPVGRDLEKLRNGFTMPGALMTSWIAAGLGSYGLFRYRSFRMTVVALLAFVVAFLSALRFWLLVMPI
jgi:hypothetical protein